MHQSCEQNIDLISNIILGKSTIPQIDMVFHCVFETKFNVGRKNHMSSRAAKPMGLYTLVRHPHLKKNNQGGLNFVFLAF